MFYEFYNLYQIKVYKISYKLKRNLIKFNFWPFYPYDFSRRILKNQFTKKKMILFFFKLISFLHLILKNLKNLRLSIFSLSKLYKFYLKYLFLRHQVSWKTLCNITLNIPLYIILNRHIKCINVFISQRILALKI